MKNYTFDSFISKEVLENYLSRAVTAAGLVNSDTLEDDLRMVKNIGAKFLGRASGLWELSEDDDEHFKKSSYCAMKVHEIDPDIILQTCIFEAVYRGVENIKIPEWVFEAFNISVEDRNFKFEDMLFDDKPEGFIWDTSGGIPNIDKLETRMWFYYRAVRYIDAGYEAIHMGQVHLYSANDVGYEKVSTLFKLIRKYAKNSARRHMIILDAHTHGISINEEVLFDFHSIPFSRMPIMDVAGDKLCFVREGYSEGGITPSGWKCETLPFLMEFDNWGGKFFEDEDDIPVEKRAWMEWWGCDQITWFALQDHISRNQYLEYAYKWTYINAPDGYCQMPVMRSTGNCEVKVNNSGSSYMYKANMPSNNCPLGFGQEETIKRLWESEGKLTKLAGNPAQRSKGHFGIENTYDKITGLKFPDRVILYGNLQHHLGAINKDSNNETTRMYHEGNGIYSYVCILPFKNEYEYAVAPYGTLSQVYSIDKYPRSGSCIKAILKVDKDNSVIKFTFNFMTKELKADIYI